MPEGARPAYVRQNGRCGVLYPKWVRDINEELAEIASSHLAAAGMEEARAAVDVTDAHLGAEIIVSYRESCPGCGAEFTDCVPAPPSGWVTPPVGGGEPALRKNIDRHLRETVNHHRAAELVAKRCSCEGGPR